MPITTRVFKAKLEDLIPTSNNPRQISKKDFDILKKSLKEFPEMREIREIVVDENMTILGGHQRLKGLQALGETEVTVKQVSGLSEEQKREFVIKDNIANGEWDMDILANEWDDLPLNEWGLDTPAWEEYEDVIGSASENTIKDYNEDTNYNLKNLYREKISDDIKEKIEDGIKKGKIRPEIADVIKTRAMQCSIFNFDEIIKFYRSGDASIEEKELLKRLYLVFITPKEAFENAQLKLGLISEQIYDDELTSKNGEDYE